MAINRPLNILTKSHWEAETTVTVPAYLKAMIVADRE